MAAINATAHSLCDGAITKTNFEKLVQRNDIGKSCCPSFLRLFHRANRAIWIKIDGNVSKSFETYFWIKYTNQSQSSKWVEFSLDVRYDASAQWSETVIYSPRNDWQRCSDRTTIVKCKWHWVAFLIATRVQWLFDVMRMLQLPLPPQINFHLPEISVLGPIRKKIYIISVSCGLELHQTMILCFCKTAMMLTKRWACCYSDS